MISECKIVIRDIGLAVTIYNKFNEIWGKVGIKDKSVTRACADKIRKMTWLIFIIAKGKFNLSP